MSPGLFTQQAAARLSRPPTLRGYLGQAFAIQTVSSLPLAKRIKSRTLIMTGTDDPMVPEINSRVLHRLIPNSHLEVINGGGHLFLLDSADDVAPVIARFLDHA